jgi:endonuclease/exonuclease/phosphatase family metal-dependent hydrolase
MARKSKRAAGSGGRAVRPRANVVTADNDNLSEALADIVPEEFRGTNKYLDVVQWNLEWFGAQKSKARDKQRRDLVLSILGALNGDLFVFQEVAGPSKDGRYQGLLDEVAEDLKQRGDGEYVVYYTKAGGEQRIAMMWDQTWLRAKTDVKQLFKAGTHKVNNKDAFAQRTPLYGFFEAKVPSGAPAAPNGGGTERFEFQILGVHLKAMADGAEQRLASAKVLAKWLKDEAPLIDADAMIMGDWNAPPSDPCWAPFHALEGAGAGQNRVRFRDINDPSDYSYLWLENLSTKMVSRIDLAAMTLSSADQVVGDAAQAVLWKPIQEAIAIAGKLSDKKVRDVMRQLKEEISDHLPVVTRFYFKGDQN